MKNDKIKIVVLSVLTLFLFTLSILFLLYNNLKGKEVERKGLKYSRVVNELSISSDNKTAFSNN